MWKILINFVQFWRFWLIFVGIKPVNFGQSGSSAKKSMLGIFSPKIPNNFFAGIASLKKLDPLQPIALRRVNKVSLGYATKHYSSLFSVSWKWLPFSSQVDPMSSRKLTLRRSYCLKTILKYIITRNWSKKCDELLAFLAQLY